MRGLAPSSIVGSRVRLGQSGDAERKGIPYFSMKTPEQNRVVIALCWITVIMVYSKRVKAQTFPTPPEPKITILMSLFFGIFMSEGKSTGPSRSVNAFSASFQWNPSGGLSGREPVSLCSA